MAKTPVREIRIIDGDEFLQHNAFHAPGAPCIDQLREAPRKIDYLSGIYSNMHKGQLESVSVEGERIEFRVR